MTINVLFQEDASTFDTELKSSSTSQDVGFKTTRLNEPVEFVGPSAGGTSDYNKLINKPIINSIELKGSLTARDLGLANVYYDTMANWAKQPTLITEEAAIYIYSDYGGLVDGAGNIIPIAGIKIGDGTSYLIDMPFITDQLTAMISRHIANNNIHVTAAEKELWNHKVSSYLVEGDLENLVLSKTQYVINGDIMRP